MNWNLSCGEPSEGLGRAGFHGCEQGSSKMGRLSQDVLSKGQDPKDRRVSSSNYLEVICGLDEERYARSL